MLQLASRRRLRASGLAFSGKLSLSNCIRTFVHHSGIRSLRKRLQGVETATLAPVGQSSLRTTTSHLPGCLAYVSKATVGMKTNALRISPYLKRTTMRQLRGAMP